MKRYIKCSTDSALTLLYHGGSGRPKVSNQKELGIHCSNNVYEATYHMSTALVKCEVDVSNALSVRDMNNWASLEAFYAILDAAGVSDSRTIATTLWRDNNCQVNTVAASSVMRDALLGYDITCIHYVDEHEFPGTDCYILLEDPPFKLVTDLAEGWPNVAEANNYLPEDKQISLYFQMNKPYYVTSRSLEPVPKSWYELSGREIARKALDAFNEDELNRSKSVQVLQQMSDLIASDFEYDIRLSDSALLVCAYSNSWLDSNNPRVAVRGRRVSYDNRINAITVPANCDVDTVYVSKVKPFIESCL